MTAEKVPRDAGDTSGLLDQTINDPTISDEPIMTVELPLGEPPSDEEAIAELFDQGRRDFEESVRRALREEMDSVAEARYRTPSKLDAARELLRTLGLEAGIAPDAWLTLLEDRHRAIGPVLPVTNGETRLELTHYRTLALAASVIPATVPDRGLVVLFEDKELRARNGRRFHKRAWTDVLDEGIIGSVRAPHGGMSSALQAALRFLPGYSRNLRRWREI